MCIFCFFEFVYCSRKLKKCDLYFMREKKVLYIVNFDRFLEYWGFGV